MLKEKIMNVRMLNGAAVIAVGLTMNMAVTSCGGDAQQQQAPAPEIATMTVAHN